MTAIRFVLPEEQVFTRRDRGAVEYVDGDSQGGHDVAYIFPGGERELQLFEVRLPPGASVAPHAHTLDEIILVQAGELQFGARRCGPGSAVYIEANTLYAFRAGPDGVTYRNIRPEGGAQYLSKDDVMARREGR